MRHGKIPGRDDPTEEAFDTDIMEIGIRTDKNHEALPLSTSKMGPYADFHLPLDSKNKNTETWDHPEKGCAPKYVLRLDIFWHAQIDFVRRYELT